MNDHSKFSSNFKIVWELETVEENFKNSENIYYY